MTEQGDCGISIEEWNDSVRVHLHERAHVIESAVTDADWLHPAAAVTLGDWLSDLRHTADEGDFEAFDRIAAMVTNKMDLERGFK